MNGFGVCIKDCEKSCNTPTSDFVDLRSSTNPPTLKKNLGAMQYRPILILYILQLAINGKGFLE
jgi:hypothetical protein